MLKKQREIVGEDTVLVRSEEIIEEGVYIQEERTYIYVEKLQLEKREKLIR